MDRHQSKITITICLVIAAIVVFVGTKIGPKQPEVPAYVKSLPVVNAETPKLTSVVASDGKMTLTMKEQKTKEGTTYTFTSQNLNYTKTVPLGVTMSIPANTFSPDDKYVFLKEEGLGDTHYIVMTTSGAPIKEGVQTTEISALFMAKYQNYKITDVTGWGGMNLLVVNTDKVGGGQGPSFWFELPSQGFIQLSNRFN